MSRDSEVARIEAALSDVLSYTNYDDDTAQKLYDAGLRRSTSRDSEVREAMSAREAMIHRLEAVTKKYGVTVAPGVWLHDLDAVEAEAVGAERERIASAVEAGAVDDLLRSMLSREAPTIEQLANALAVVFAYNASNASVAPNGSLAFGEGPTSYWRDRAEAVVAALAAAEDR